MARPVHAFSVPKVMPGETSADAEQLRLLIDSGTDFAIHMLDPEGRVVIWNRGAEAIQGWSRAEVVGSDVATLYPPDVAARGKPAADLAQARALGRVEEESWQLRKDGTEFLAHVTLTALCDDTGALRGFGRVVRDITDETASRTALIRREHHLRSILASVPDAMVIFDESGVVSSFSTAAERMFGYTEEDVVGRHMAMLIPQINEGDQVPPRRIPVEAGILLVVGDPAPDHARRKTGEVFPIEFAVGEAAIAGERIFTGFIRDLATRRSTERRMHELQSELIHVSRVSAMDTMASTLAHEINQPLTAVTNYVESVRAMLGGSDDPLLIEAAQALDLAAAQALRAGTIVRQLRAFVVGGDVGARIEPLGTLMDEAAALGLLGTRASGITVSTTIAAARDRVMVDRVQIQQVIVNLIRNAVQAMAATPQKDLTISASRDGDRWVRVTVADSGTGIDPQVREHLFDAFTTTKHQGMGLGLSICRTIVEAHGGRIWADGLAGGGTAFHFSIPLAEERCD